MQVKCTSCGAPQTKAENNICIYCNSEIQNRIIASDNAVSSFTLALFEYNKGNLRKAEELFDEIIKSNPNNFLAWMYKVICTFNYNFEQHVKEYNPFLDRQYTFSWSDFQKDIVFVTQRFNEKQNMELFEKNLINIFNAIFLKTYKKSEYALDQNIFYFDQYPVSIFKLLCRLSELFSDDFHTEIINILIRFFNKFYYDGRYPGPNQLSSDATPLFLKDLHLAEVLIGAILESNIKYLGNKVNGMIINNYRIDKYDLGQGKMLIEFLKHSDLLNFHDIYNNYNIQIANIESRVEAKIPQLKKLSPETTKSSCFIATAAMGDYDHPVVVDLRMFRDNWLLKREWGVNFINWYYTHGPKAARVIEKSLVLKKLTFIFIVKPLQLVTHILAYK